VSPDGPSINISYLVFRFRAIHFVSSVVSESPDCTVVDSVFAPRRWYLCTSNTKILALLSFPTGTPFGTSGVTIFNRKPANRRSLACSKSTAGSLTATKISLTTSFTTVTRSYFHIQCLKREGQYMYILRSIIMKDVFRSCEILRATLGCLC